MRPAVVLTFLAILLTGCGSVDIETYQGNEPTFVPERFFSGDLTAHGVVKNRAGKVIRYFNATIVASWQDGVGTLDEVFYYNDGETDTRTWTLTPTGAGKYSATAGDVVGSAEAETAGNVMHLNYVLEVPYGDGTINLSMDDWMFLVDENTVINHTEMRKFGFKVGELVITIIKQP